LQYCVLPGFVCLVVTYFKTVIIFI
jgi:hypothetical protein